MFNSYVIWLRSFFWFCRIFSHRQVLRSELTLQNFSIFFHSVQNSKKIITEKVKQNKMKRSTVVALCISAAGFCVVAAAFVYFVILTPQTKVDSHSNHTEVPTQWVENNSNWNNLFVLLNLTNPVTFCYIWIRNHLNILFVKIEWYSSGWIATMHPKRWVNKRNHFFSIKISEDSRKIKKITLKKKSHETLNISKKNVKDFRWTQRHAYCTNIVWNSWSSILSIDIPTQKVRLVKLNESVNVLHASGDEESIQQLIEQGVDVNSQDQYSNNALNWATKKGEFVYFRSADWLRNLNVFWM